MSALGAAVGASFMCPTPSVVEGVSAEVLNGGWAGADSARVASHLRHGHHTSLVSLWVDGRPRALQESLETGRLINKKCPSLQIVSGDEPK
jgi:hypothetical protein